RKGGSMLDSITTKIFADGAEIDGIVRLAADPRISGITTNPTLMRKAGITDYPAFARRLVELLPNFPISLEVFADDPDEIRRQAQLIAGWGENVFVKVPVTTTAGEPLAAVARALSEEGIQV